MTMPAKNGPSVLSACHEDLWVRFSGSSAPPPPARRHWPHALSQICEDAEFRPFISMAMRSAIFLG